MINILIWGILGASSFLLFFVFLPKLEPLMRKIKKEKGSNTKEEPLPLKYVLGNVLTCFLCGVLCGWLGYLNILGAGVALSAEFRDANRLNNSFAMAAMFSPLINIWVNVWVYEALFGKYEKKHKRKK